MPAIEVATAKYRRIPVLLTVVVVVSALALLARMPSESVSEIARLAAHFRFTTRKSSADPGARPTSSTR